jgi:RimJ/RimL family protein N-acetyltransferase
MFGILETSTKEIIGVCGLLYINWISRSADFSFYIGKDQAYIDGKGFADDATQLLIQYGFEELNLNKIWMELYEFDKAKIDFFTKKFKFHQDGLLRENTYKNGKYWDSTIISLLRSDFMSSRQ